MEVYQMIILHLPKRNIFRRNNEFIIIIQHWWNWVRNLIDHEPVNGTLPPPCGEVSPIPSFDLGSEGSKTGCLPILKFSEHWVTAPARSGGQIMTQIFFFEKCVILVVESYFVQKIVILWKNRCITGLGIIV